MEITHPDQIDGPAAREIRLALSKTQPDFWGALGVGKSTASSYESGRHKVPDPTKILIYLIYVCRFPAGLPHKDMLQIGGAMSMAASSLEQMKTATMIVEAAAANLKSAQKCMSGIA